MGDLSMLHSVSWYFLGQKIRPKKTTTKTTACSTRLSHHKEYIQMGKCLYCIHPLKGLSRSQCKSLSVDTIKCVLECYLQSIAQLLKMYKPSRRRVACPCLSHVLMYWSKLPSSDAKIWKHKDENLEGTVFKKEMANILSWNQMLLNVLQLSTFPLPPPFLFFCSLWLL